MTYAEAERWVLDLEVFGMRFGLERMRRLMTVLDSPQERFRAVHVVGSNGKSSTARMTAALLRAQGLRTGTYLSPHFVEFTERIRVDDADVAPEAFAHAIARVRDAAARVDRSFEDRVTQFEALTAAGILLLAEAGVDVAVIEAGLGGRYDATNVLGAEVVVLTNVGLEHTRWLGPTIAGIAEEKLAVVHDRTRHVVVGHGLHPDARAVAERVARDRLVTAPAAVDVPLAPYQRRNLATAATAARAVLGEDAVLDLRAAAATATPGRFEVVAEAPLTILDGAHNPEGVAALAEALRGVLDGRRLVVALSVLDDKDVPAMLRELAPLAERVVCTASRNPRTLPAGTLHTLAGQLGIAAEVEPDPAAALARARALAGPGGVALATGSLYLLADLKRGDATRRASAL